MRHAHTTQGTGRRLFQFTHPGRGATAHYGVDVPRGRGVSIHAPREGCDSEILILDDQPSMFQFTHPGRGATVLVLASVAVLTVSIHAPREGCDKYLVDNLQQVTGFNSRTPGGVRRRRCVAQIYLLWFQFTHPGRGATPLRGVCPRDGAVSIHAPREGCDATASHSFPTS